MEPSRFLFPYETHNARSCREPEEDKDRIRKHGPGRRRRPVHKRRPERNSDPGKAMQFETESARSFSANGCEKGRLKEAPLVFRKIPGISH